MTINRRKYNLSFTAGAAMLNETYAVAKAYLDCDKDWTLTKITTLNENLMEKGKLSSNKRYFALVKQRIEVLNDDELIMLVSSTVAVRRAIVLLAICKAHSFIYEFITENVRDSFYNMQEKVTHATFNEFYNEIRYEHTEIENITEQTLAKARQVIFRILEQTELIESVDSGVIRRPYLTEELERIIVKDDPKWLSIYLYSNNEIVTLNELYAQ